MMIFSNQEISRHLTDSIFCHQPKLSKNHNHQKQALSNSGNFIGVSGAHITAHHQTNSLGMRRQFENKGG
jgi:hypothetical protein